MRDDFVRLRSKNNDLCDERSSLKQQQESIDAEGQIVLADRDSTIANLWSLLDRRNQELDGLQRSVTTTQEERTRLQLQSNELTVSIVSLRQELEDARVVTIDELLDRGTPTSSRDQQQLSEPVKNSCCSNPGCYRLPLIPMGLVTSSATLLSCHPCQLLRRDAH